MDDEALERLENRVDSKPGSDLLRRRPLQHETPNTPPGWQHPQQPPRKPSFFSRVSPLEIIFGVSIVFFIGAAAVATLLVFSGENTVSTKNVAIAVSGPASVRAGDVVTLQIVITNQNAVAMNLTDLLVEYPTGTRSEQDVSVDLPRIRESLGTIEPGESVNRTLKAVMFGERGAQLEVKVTAEYRVPSSNAVFQSSSTYRATVSQSPATISVESLKEVVSGQATEVKVKVVSNATENLTGMLLVATYPPGFSFTSSEPKALAGSAVWDLGDIEPGGSRTVTIKGTFAGEDGDDRVLHFTTGTKKKTDPGAIAAPLAATDATLKVAKPFVSVQLALDGDTTGERSAARGQVVKGEVRWTNNLPVRVQDVEIELKLNGAVLDKNTVRSSSGFFRSGDNTILFSKETDARLANVEAGTSQVSGFEFAALPPGQGSFKSAQIALSVTVRGKRIAETSVPEVVTGSAQALVVVATDLALQPSLVKVSGPASPKVDQESVYTVTWSVTNSANALANTVVSAVLPSYVEWRGQASADMTYNANGRSVTWTIGDLAAGTSRNGSFQVAFAPSVSQVNTTPVVVGDQRISAFDRFIRAAVERSAAPVTTATGSSLVQGTVVP